MKTKDYDSVISKERALPSYAITFLKKVVMEEKANAIQTSFGHIQTESEKIAKRILDRL